MQTVTEILIDFSSSMQGKLALAKKVILNDILPKLDYSAQIGIKTFSANGKIPKINSVLPLSITNKEKLIECINLLKSPYGNTPIAEAIKNSILNLKDYPAYDKKIILITDGEENCGGDYRAEAKKALDDGLYCQIHIIGIGLDLAARNQAKEISSISNGSFNFIPFSNMTGYNQTSIRNNLSSFYNSVRRSVPNGRSVFPVSQPIIKPASNSTSSSKPIEIIPAANTPTNSEPIKEFEKVQEIESSKEPLEVEKNREIQGEKDDLQFSNETVKLVLSELKSLKDQISSLKKENFSEIEEDPILNERVRKNSEEYLYNLLKKKYGDRVKWLNKDGESYADHDFEILDFDGSIEIYIECKGTSQEDSQFYLTKSEWRLFLNHTKNYQVYFVKTSLNNPSHIYIDNLLDWVLRGKIVPYTREKKTIKEDRVLLTILE